MEAKRQTVQARLWHTAKYYSIGIYKRFSEEDVFLWTGAIAFKVMIAFIPLAILATGTIGLVFNTFYIAPNQTPFEAAASFFQNFLPQYHSEALLRGVESLSREASTYTYIGLIGFFILAMSLFSTLHTVIANVFRELHHERPWWRQYAFDIRMVVQVGVLLLLSVAVGILLTGKGFTEFFDGTNQTWLISLWKNIASGLSFYLLPFVISLVVFFQLYFFIPKPHPPLRSALLGAFLTTSLWEVTKSIFTWYAIQLQPFDRFATRGIELNSSDWGPTLGDVVGIILVLVFWAYYSGLVFIFGAMIAALHERRLLAKRSKILFEESILIEG